METISFRIESFEGPLDLLLALVEKNKINIEDIPIDVICDQYMEYIRDASNRNIDLACEFLLMASELMLIKSRMLLPREEERGEDPRKPIIDALLEYQKTKIAAAELSELYGEYGSRMVKEQEDLSPDRTFVADHSSQLLAEALARVLAEAELNASVPEREFDRIVNIQHMPVRGVISSLIGTLRKSGTVYLDGYLSDSASREEIITKFLAILELLKSHVITIEETRDPETGVTDMASHAKMTLISGGEDLGEIEEYV